MSRCPFARWLGPVPNKRPGGMVRPVLGIVLHVQQGTENGTDAWFHNPAAQASAHFGNPKSGDLDQWVDTDDAAWAQAAGNSRWWSVENEGRTGDALTDTQVSNLARLLAWGHEEEGISFAVTDDVNVGGLAWHGMGGTAWGSHPDCPGEPIKAQRGLIVAKAIELHSPPTPPPAPVVTDFPEDHMKHIAIRVQGDTNHGPVGLDDQGNGSTLLDVPMPVFNAYPNTAGYTVVPEFVGAEDEGGKAKIIWKGPPNFPPFDAHVLVPE